MANDLRGDRVPVREHIPCDQELVGLQSEGGCPVGRGEGPRGQRWVLGWGLCEVLPLWAGLLVGALQNFVGYGWLWLIVTGRAQVLPLWAMCALVFIGTNGETYFNTVALVSSVQNFPKTRGPDVGILKGFAGLGGAILTKVYALIQSPEHANLIFLIAIGPFMVAISLMFIIRPVGGHKQVHPTDGRCFTFVYSVCLLLAAYLMGVMIVEDLVELSYTFVVTFTGILFVLLLLPILIPVTEFLLGAETATSRTSLGRRAPSLENPITTLMRLFSVRWKMKSRRKWICFLHLKGVRGLHNCRRSCSKPRRKAR